MTSITRAEPKRVKPSKRHYNTIRSAPYLFTLPFVISFLLFFAYPMVYMVIMSFQRLEGISNVTYIGLKNYQRLLSDSHVVASVLNSVYFTIGIIVLNVVLALLLAVVLNNKMTPCRNAFRSALYLPALTSIIVAGVFFRLFFGSAEGTPLNRIMQMLGQEPRAWLYDNVLSGIFAIVITSTWRWLGTNMIYFLCGLQSIPMELYEACDIDGANAFQRFRYITIPGLRPIIIFVVTILTYGGLRMFGESYVLWANGTTPADIGLTFVLYIYRTAFTKFNTGYAASMSTALFTLLIIINIIYIKLLKIGEEA